MKSDEKSEFARFMSTKELMPPVDVDDRVRRRILSDLRPAFASVFRKILALHAACLALTLSVCPQFGLGPVGGGHGIMHFVMDYGALACAAFCAAFFFGATSLAAVFVLSGAEKQAFNTRAAALSISVSALSVFFFMILDVGTGIVEVEPLSGLVWAVVGAGILYVASQSARLPSLT